MIEWVNFDKKLIFKQINRIIIFNIVWYVKTKVSQILFDQHYNSIYYVFISNIILYKNIYIQNLINKIAII